MILILGLLALSVLPVGLWWADRGCERELTAPTTSPQSAQSSPPQSP